MNELEIIKQNLSNCMETIKKTKRKHFFLRVADNFSVCAGIISAFGVLITPIALIPLGAFIGLDAYVTKKEEQTEMKLCTLKADRVKFENEIFKESKKEMQKTYNTSSSKNKVTEKTLNDFDKGLDMLENNDFNEAFQIDNNKNKTLIKKL